MYEVAFYIDGGEGTDRAEVFACAATEAAFRVDGRDFHLGIVWQGHHCDCTRGTIFSAVAAGYAVFLWKAIVLDPDGVSGSDGGLLLACDGLDSSGWANFAAFGTFGTAISVFKSHFGLHEGGEFGRRSQYAVGTGSHAELTAGAFVGERTQTH